MEIVSVVEILLLLCAYVECFAIIAVGSVLATIQNPTQRMK